MGILGNPFGVPHVLTNQDGQTVTIQVFDYGLHLDTDETGEGLDIPRLQADESDPDMSTMGWIGGRKFRWASD